MITERIVKIALALLFFLCLFDMTYGFYQLVRFSAFVGFGILAYISFERENRILMIVYLGFALLFQPFIKIHLGREIWNIADVTLGIGLIISMFLKYKDNV